jgi:enamine deaminase RidA (YjgF/YER057c/UK114 family)
MSNAEDLVKTYLMIRNERDAQRSKYESADAELKAQLEVIEQALLSLCNEINTNGLKTTFGTVTRSVKDRFFCTDWDNFKKFLAEVDGFDLLERRIHQRNFKEFVAEHQNDGLPPGVNVLREYDIVVRKSSTPVEV